MHITHLTIEDLRPISRLDLDLAVRGAPRRRVILLGINGAGKTTALEAVAYAFQRLQAIGGHDPLLRASDVRRRPEGIEPTDTPVAVVSLDTVLSSEEHAAARETQPSALRSGTLRFELGTRRSAASRERGAASAVQDLLYAGLPGSLALGGWHDVTSAAARLASKAPCVYLPADRGVLTYRDDLPLAEVVQFDPREGAVTKNRARFGALAARLALAFSGNKSLDETGAFSRMWKVLAKYLPELPRPVAVDGVMLMFQTPSRVLVRLTDLSEGERAVLLLFAELAGRLAEDGIALIDELEQHLHVRWQRGVLDALTAMMPSAQVIVTSQSPYLAANASDDIVKLGEWDQSHA